MRGQMYAWIVILVLVFVTGFLWIIFSEIYHEYLFPEFEEHLSSNNETAITFTWIKNVWNYWPLILIFGLIIYGIVSALRKEPYSQYG